MKAKSIIEISKGKYVDMDSGKTPSLSEINAFKKKNKANQLEIDERFSSRRKEWNDFVVSHKQDIEDLLGEEEPEMFIDRDRSVLVYNFSTALFDCINNDGTEKWLANVKKRMGKRFYYDVIEGYVLGNHDT